MKQDADGRHGPEQRGDHDGQGNLAGRGDRENRRPECADRSSEEEGDGRLRRGKNDDP